MSAAGSLIAAVARILLGPPNAQLSSAIEWRYGTQGSLAINLVKNVWHDHEAGRGGGVLELIKRETALDGRDCFGWLEQHGLRAMAEACAIATPGRDGGIAAIYNYTDERDTLLFQVVRYNPKRFVQRRPNVSGWTWSTVGVRQVPYRLPEVLEAIALERTVVLSRARGMRTPCGELASRPPPTPAGPASGSENSRRTSAAQT
jgi:putative DNA primase/helicase